MLICTKQIFQSRGREAKIHKLVLKKSEGGSVTSTRQIHKCNESLLRYILPIIEASRIQTNSAIIHYRNIISRRIFQTPGLSFSLGLIQTINKEMLVWLMMIHLDHQSMCGYVCGELQTHSLRGGMVKTTPIKAGTWLIVALRAGGVMMVTSMLSMVATVDMEQIWSKF